MHSTVHASKIATHSLCLKSCILQCTLSHFIFMYWYTSNSKCEGDLFVVRASGAHELKANPRVNTSKWRVFTVYMPVSPATHDPFKGDLGRCLRSYWRGHEGIWGSLAMTWTNLSTEMRNHKNAWANSMFSKIAFCRTNRFTMWATSHMHAKI